MQIVGEAENAKVKILDNLEEQKKVINELKALFEGARKMGIAKKAWKDFVFFDVSAAFSEKMKNEGFEISESNLVNGNFPFSKLAELLVTVASDSSYMEQFVELYNAPEISQSISRRILENLAKEIECSTQGRVSPLTDPMAFSFVKKFYDTLYEEFYRKRSIDEGLNRAFDIRPFIYFGKELGNSLARLADLEKELGNISLAHAGEEINSSVSQMLDGEYSEATTGKEIKYATDFLSVIKHREEKIDKIIKAIKNANRE